MSIYKSFSDLGTKPPPNRDLYSVLELKTAEEKRDILSRNEIVVIDIYANWCHPCKQIEPGYSVVAQKYSQSGKCAVVKENFDTHLSQNVNGVPTFRIYQHGVVIDEIVGADLPKVEAKLEELMSTNDGPSYQRHTIRQNSSPYRGQSIHTENA